MTTLAIGHTKCGAVWVNLFNTREEALVFKDKAESLSLPDHEVFDMHWDLIPIEPTTVDAALKELMETTL